MTDSKSKQANIMSKLSLQIQSKIRLESKTKNERDKLILQNQVFEVYYDKDLGFSLEHQNILVKDVADDDKQSTDSILQYASDYMIEEFIKSAFWYNYIQSNKRKYQKKLNDNNKV